MSRPQRIQLRRTKGWRLHDISPNAVVVARPSKWGNPWRITREVNLDMPFGRGAVIQHVHTAAILGHVRAGDAAYWAVLAYRRDLTADQIQAARTELAGHDLACWCPPGPCHADVLLDIANGGAE